MKTLSILFLFVLVFSTSLVSATFNVVSGTDDSSEEWGYVEVRPKAHMFWWHYKSPYKVEDPSNPWPIILWLQGGPGSSGVGFGNFLEIGPLDANLDPRNSTWLRKADLLFVDNPVGAGFSYAEDKNLLVRTDVEAATDLTTLLKVIFNQNDTLQKSPLFIFAESYGGKFAVTTALTAAKAIKNGELKLQLGGVALGDSWISPQDFCNSWGPLLKDMSRIDDIAMNTCKSLAHKIQQQLAAGNFSDVTETWGLLENFIIDRSNKVDFYNFMLDRSEDPVVASEQSLAFSRYSTYFSTKSSAEANLPNLMNGPIKQKLKIIPDDVSWGDQSEAVFSALTGDFMNPRIAEVDELLAKGINVTVYNGQVDLICSTKGVESWITKLKWEGLKNYSSSSRTPLYCGSDGTITKGFFKTYKNFFFYWILGAGHFVPVDQPCMSLQMVGSITHSPSKS